MNSLLPIMISIITAHFPEHQHQAAKIAEIVFCSAAQRAKAMAQEAITALINVGINPAELPLHDFLAFAARLHVEKLHALGLVQRGQFKASAAYTNEHLATIYGATTVKERRNTAFFINVCLFLEQIFSPVRKVLIKLEASGSLGESPEDKFITTKPFSEGALKRLDSLSTVNFTNLRKRPEVAIPRTIAELLQEHRITEAEAARVMRISPKTLADKRRDGLIPRNLYVQDVKDGTVYYIVKNLLKYIEGEQATVKPAAQHRG